MRQPYLDETFVGGPSGAFLLRPARELRLRASGRTELGEAILYSTHPGMFAAAAERAGFARLGGGADDPLRRRLLLLLPAGARARSTW